MSSGYVVAVLAVSSGSAAHGIARKEDVTSVELLLRRREPQLHSVPGLQQEGIHTAVGIARVVLWDYTNLEQHLKDKHTQLHKEFQQKVEVENATTLSSSPPFWQISLRA